MPHWFLQEWIHSTGIHRNDTRICRNGQESTGMALEWTKMDILEIRKNVDFYDFFRNVSVSLFGQLRFNLPPNYVQRSFEIPPICSCDLHAELTLCSNCACNITLTELLNADVWKQLYGWFKGLNPTWWSVSIPQYHFDAISIVGQILQGWYASSRDSALTNKLLGYDWVFKIWQWHRLYGQYQG